MKSTRSNCLPMMLAVIVFITTAERGETTPVNRPNVVIVYADDMGCGDVGYMNPQSKIPTPHIDRLAKEGLHFTDAHSSGSICSPSRYGLLAGRYSWRTDTRGNPGVGSPHLIEPDRMTLASLFKSHGYDTACVGKWGLGAGWNSAANEDWKRTPVDTENIDFLKFHWGEAQMRTVARSVQYIDAKGEGQAGGSNFHQKKDAPVFLYCALHVPHGPYFVDEQFFAKSKAGQYGDYVVQLDWSVGQIRSALERNGFLDNTIFIFTADNGVDPNQYSREKKHGHVSRGKKWSGGKGTAYEGGHRVPTVISGLRDVEPGSVCDHLICQTDFLATFAEMLGTELPDDAGEDSISFLPVLKGNLDGPPARNSMIYSGFFGGFRLGLRYGDWVYLAEATGKKKKEKELYNLASDSRQKKNLTAKQSGKAAEMAQILADQVAKDRTR